SATVTDAAGGSGLAEVWYTQSGTDSATGKVVMPLTSGSIYKSPYITASKTYYVWARDNAGNITTPGVAVVVDKVDSVPPVIAFTQEGIEDQKIRVRFTVKEVEAGASGVAVESVKYGIVPNDRNAQAVTNFTLDADAGKSGSGYFDVDKNGTYYIMAMDKAGNSAQYGPILTSDTLISVEMPTKMLFAVAPNLNHGTEFVAPEFEIKNKSAFREIKVSMDAFHAGSNNQFTLLDAAGTPSENSLKMYIKNVVGLSDITQPVLIVPGAAFKEIPLGSIARYNGTNGIGKFTFAGDTYEYPVGMSNMAPLRADFTFRLKIMTGEVVA
ncbi:MAG: hypothetical protein RR826_06695, partial [Christensenellaceae bacterium]